MRLYGYVGPKHIADRIGAAPAGVPIRSPNDVRTWMRNTDQEPVENCVTATFVVDASGALLIADRRSEHVVCAGGKAVVSAGEITFAIGRSVKVVAVSNQSTGYCPEPESWPAVAEALSNSLRHIFRTIAGGASDLEATRLIMGHVVEHVEGAYIEGDGSSDERLQKVVDVVRAWLLKDSEPEQPKQRPLKRRHSLRVVG